MGWGRMFLLGDWGQQMDIEDHREEIQRMRRRSRRSQSEFKNRLATLERENDELRLYLAALIRHLGGKGVLDRAEFTAIVDAVDIEDGEADGGYDGEIVR